MIGRPAAAGLAVQRGELAGLLDGARGRGPDLLDGLPERIVGGHLVGERRREAERLAAAGFAEIVVTGIHVGLYGRDPPERPGLASALHAVADAPDDELVRRGAAGRDPVRSRFTVAAERDGYLAVLDATAGATRGRS